MFFSRKKDPETLYYDMLARIVSAGGLLKSSGVRKFKDPDMAKEILNKMIRDGALTIKVKDKNSYEYIFPAVPEKYNPAKVSTVDEFYESLTRSGIEAEDGHIFLSEIIFAFKIFYDDIIEALESYCENEFVTRNISKSGNVYFMFDKDIIDNDREDN